MEDYKDIEEEEDNILIALFGDIDFDEEGDENE